MNPTSDDSNVTLLRTVREHGVQVVCLQHTDMLGRVWEITVPATGLEKALAEGVVLDGEAARGAASNRETERCWLPDPATFALLPPQLGGTRAARFICDVRMLDGTPWPGSPRSVLARAMDEAAAMGFGYYVAPEIEFFLLPMEVATASRLAIVGKGVGSYDRTIGEENWRRELLTVLEALGIPVGAGYHEVAGGQHEIDLGFAEALAAADHLIVCRYTLQVLARQQGMCATFMPKPLMGCAGSGMHVHQYLTDAATGGNAFADLDDPYGLSEVGRQFIAGQLLHARGMAAVLAPLVNSYKRLVPGHEAPILVGWGRGNQSALMRVPRSLRPADTRIELRCPDPSCNPYLALAVMLHCGLDGIRRGLELGRPLDENLSEADWARVGFASLPGTLWEALEELGRDQVVQDALGPEICQQLCAAKRAEWIDYSLEVTPWERARYLGIF